MSNEHALESCQPNHDPVLAAHEAGHVVVRAAFGLPTDFAHVCTHEDGFFPSGARCVSGAATVGMHGSSDEDAVATLAGGIAESLYGNNRQERFSHKYDIKDRLAFIRLAERMNADAAKWIGFAESQAREIIESNRTAWEAVTELLLCDQWVTGESLDVLTATVATVEPAPLPIRAEWPAP